MSGINCRLVVCILAVLMFKNRIDNNSSSSSQYCAGRRLMLHIRTLEVRPDS